MNHKILDTFIFKNGRLYLKEYHIERTCETLHFLKKNKRSEVEKIYNLIEEQYSFNSLNAIYRIEINPEDLTNWKINTRPQNQITEPLKLKLCTPHRENRNGLYKWADRSFWDDYNHLITEQTDVLLATTENKLIETSRFNVVVFDSERDIAMTPPLSSGCLKGVYREYCLQSSWIDLPVTGRKKIIEADIYVADLKKYQLYLINSVRDVLSAVIRETN